MLYNLLKTIINDPRTEQIFADAAAKSIATPKPIPVPVVIKNNPPSIKVKPKEEEVVMNNAHYDKSTFKLLKLSAANDPRVISLRTFWTNIGPLFNKVDLLEPISQKGDSLVFNLKVKYGSTSTTLSFGVRAYSEANEVSIYKGSILLKRNLIVTDANFLVNYFTNLLQVNSVASAKKSYKLSSINKNTLFIPKWRVSGDDCVTQKTFTPDSATKYLKNVYDNFKPSSTYNPRKLIGVMLDKEIHQMERLEGGKFKFIDSVKAEIEVSID